MLNSFGLNREVLATTLFLPVVDILSFVAYVVLTHIPHPKLSQREITERKNQSEHKNKHKERKKAFEKQ